MHNPFAQTPTQVPGHGTVHLALVGPNTPVMQTLSFQYPLKLISPAPLTVTPRQPITSPTTSTITTTGSQPKKEEEEEQSHLVHTLYTLTYGGGIVAGDEIHLSITLAPTTKLILLTQGSTKIFKSPSSEILSRQTQTVKLGVGAGLCFLPDPVQPFEKSCFGQDMRYEVSRGGGGGGGNGGGGEKGGSICVLDWVSRGRGARGEDWSFWRYGSRNEIFLVSEEDGREKRDGKAEGEGERQSKKRLILRDNLILDGGGSDAGVADRMDGKGVFGTLILYGPMFTSLGRFFMDEFKAIPRIGGRKWDSGSGDEEEVTDVEIRRRDRQKQEIKDGLLWSAASVRGCVVVKFGAHEVEGGRRWVRTMLEAEGSVVDQFGDRALMCLK